MQRNQSILKNKKLLVYMMGIGIISIMVGSVLSLWIYKDEPAEANYYEYNGYKFLRSGNGYILNFKNQNIAFNYLPADLEDIETESFNLIVNKYYIIFEPLEMDENSYEVNKVKAILNYMNILGIPACSGEDGCGNIPVKDCSIDSIYLKKGEEKIYKGDRCIVLSYYDSAKIIDLFFYRVLGVMQ